ncbi:MAG: single-stranded DNA-binding protein [Candidatus Kerfeldbacteria bacterium]
MQNLNRVTMIGQLTADPETKKIPSGQDLSTFGLATNYSWKDDSGEWQNGVDYHRVVSWKKLAQKVGKSLKKGEKVFVEGKLRTRSWVTDDGTKSFRTEIVASEILPMSSKTGKDRAAELEKATEDQEKEKE